MLTSLLVLTLAQAGVDTARPRLVILDPELRSASVVEGAAAASAVAASARDLDAFEVTTSNDIRTMMSLERQRQLMAVNAEMTTITEALGSRHVVAMWVAKLGNEFQAEVRLVDSRSGAVLAQKQTARMPSIAEVATSLGGLTQEVLGALLKEQMGKLMVRVSEEGAEILVDDKLLGSSPLADTLAIPRGKHRLEVRKDGFITSLRGLQVAYSGTTVEEVRLVPSPDFVNAYQTRNKRMRLAAWITTGTAVALLASALIVDRAVTEPAYQDNFLPRLQLLQNSNVTGVSAGALVTRDTCMRQIQDGKTADCYADAQKAKSNVESLQITSLVLAGAGVVSGIFATYFWVSTEDPNRYSRLVFVPTTSGFGFAISGGF